MKTLYKVKNNIIIAIKNVADNYSVNAGEYLSDVKFQKAEFNGSAVVEGITQEILDQRLADVKTSQIEALKANANTEFQKTSWYYERESRLDKGGRPPKPVPQSVIDSDMAIYDTVDTKEAEINALTTVEEVINYDISI